MNSQEKFYQIYGRDAEGMAFCPYRPGRGRVPGMNAPSLPSILPGYGSLA